MGAAAATAIALTGSDQVVSARPAFYRGAAISETAGSTAVVRIYDNASAASGTLLATIRLAANETFDVLFDGFGVRAVSGIYVDVVSGAVEGSIRLG
ncbi:hypothetical protein [Lentzea sp. NBRC 102530]|uniref:hypothetical protein n=1 Tax=Lentzea sp. NBRC 102530 TaxID=3032201 RepID=UPI0024A0A89E|nr:hypothetical protein [Lentzea sp. NBRC 102530]GLY55216.1 hypothetical protein Lesp01_88710 [Lentzea sp. NBRC 102530]